MTARTVSLALLTLLVAATPAWATATEKGSDLQLAPNYNSDCQSVPFPNPNDNFQTYTPAASNQPSCTWYSSGVFGVIGDTHNGYVPGDGTVHTISVRSGATPAPIRFVTMEQLTPVENGTPNTQNTVCCFFKRESAVVQPTPNAISTFTVDLPVEGHNDGRQVVDTIVGVSAQSNAGSLPIALTKNPPRVNDFTVTGTQNAAAMYPALGTMPNDSGGGREPRGYADFEVLLRFTWCSPGAFETACGGSGVAPVPTPTPTPTPAPADPGTPAGPAGPTTTPAAGPAATLARTTLALDRARRIALRVACGDDAACVGSVALRTGGKKPKTLARAKVSIPAGETEAVKLTLSKAEAKLVRKKGTKLDVVIDVGDERVGTTVKLKR